MEALLEDLTVLFIDCQTTGPTPEKGHLLEVGWAVLKARDPVIEDDQEQLVDSCFLALPEKTIIPDYVCKITGISDEDMESGLESACVWTQLKKQALILCKEQKMNECITIIHYSRFEEPFLRNLYDKANDSDPFPLKIICTHEISKLLLKGLPRKGLRAVAGYFGISVPEKRRSHYHVQATHGIWKNLVNLLRTKHQILTWVQLDAFLKDIKSVSSVKGGYQYPMEKNIRLSLPKSSGIYRMLRKNGDILYIGKAKSIKKRVNSYFQKHQHNSEHILEMLSQAKRISTMVTHSAIEAAILEAEEIKKYSPPYNKALKGNGENIFFVSKEFRSFQRIPDTIHSVGPLPSQHVAEKYYLISLLLRREPDFPKIKIQIEKSQLFREEAIWTTEAFNQGFADFHDKYKNFLLNGHPCYKLLTISKILWKEKHLQNLDETNNVLPDEPIASIDPEEKSITLWPPDRIVKYMESLIRYGGHMIRRSRWFLLLGDSTVSWSKAGGTKEDLRHVISFLEGNIFKTASISADEGIPIPPGYKRKSFDRKCNFKKPTYDRMRVFTTEIRRLLSENRYVSIRLNPYIVLDEIQLANILKWV